MDRLAKGTDDIRRLKNDGQQPEMAGDVIGRRSGFRSNVVSVDLNAVTLSWGAESPRKARTFF